jgi:hypothetical protein
MSGTAVAPILIGLTGATFLLTAETGGIIQSFQRNVESKKIAVYDGSVGATTGMVFHDPHATYTVKIITTGSTGLAAATPGATITLANTSSGNGVTTGGVYADSIQLSHDAEQLQTLTITAEQWPAIT